MFDRLDEERKQALLGGLVMGLVGVLAGGAWIWFSARAGNDPRIWAYVILGLGATGFAYAIGGGLLGASSENVRGVAGLLVLVLIVGGGWLWAKGQVGPVARAMSPVCQGTAVPEAGPFVKGDPGPYHLIVLDQDGGKNRFTGLEADWRADTAEDTELVACVREQTVLLETCSYTGGSKIERYKNVLAVKVLEAREGRKIGSFRLADSPGECPLQTEKQGTSRLEGEVSFDALSERLRFYAQGDAPGA